MIHQRPRTRVESVAAYRRWLWKTVEGTAIAVAARQELAGKPLACWCPLDGQPCHADVLIEIAQEEPR